MKIHKKNSSALLLKLCSCAPQSMSLRRRSNKPTYDHLFCKYLPMLGLVVVFMGGHRAPSDVQQALESSLLLAPTLPRGIPVTPP